MLERTLTAIMYELAGPERPHTSIRVICTDHSRGEWPQVLPGVQKVYIICWPALFELRTCSAIIYGLNDVFCTDDKLSSSSYTIAMASFSGFCRIRNKEASLPANPFTQSWECSRVTIVLFVGLLWSLVAFCGCEWYYKRAIGMGDLKWRTRSRRTVVNSNTSPMNIRMLVH
jgi:hypothetical protein